MAAGIQRSLGRVSLAGSVRGKPTARSSNSECERGNQLDDAGLGCDPEKRRTHVNGMLLSALIGLGALIIGLLIIHFTPDERRK